MPVDSTHPLYDARLTQWQKCRHAYEGEDAIKKAGVLYLPKLKGQTDEDYKAYKQRAMFYSITSKSVAAMVGMATMHPAKLKYPESMAYCFAGTKPPQFSEVFSTVLVETLLQSRCGLFIDFATDGSEPYIAIYQVEDIINWRTDAVGNVTLVVLREYFDNPIDDYSVEKKLRIRELRMINNVYTQIIHTDGEDDLVITPTVLGKELDSIPFYVVNPFGLGFTDNKPMMLDIANINLSHYLSSADLEHGRHFTGLPTPVVIGADSNSDLHIGSTKFLIIPDKGGDAKYLEFTGQGLQSLEKAMTEKQSQLASLSARLMDNSSRGSESTDAVKMRYMSETASLTTVLISIQTCLNTVYKKIAEFLRESIDDVQITIDTDVMDVALSATEMTALFNGYISGSISINTLIYNLRKGRRLNPDVDDATEIAAIKERATEIQKANEVKQPASQPNLAKE